MPFQERTLSPRRIMEIPWWSSTKDLRSILTILFPAGHLALTAAGHFDHVNARHLTGLAAHSGKSAVRGVVGASHAALVCVSGEIPRLRAIRPDCDEPLFRSGACQVRRRHLFPRLSDGRLLVEDDPLSVC